MPQIWFKDSDDRTQFSDGRETSIEEEWTALNQLYGGFPNYFPEPYTPVENGEGLDGYEMEYLELETKLEYADADGYSEETISGFVEELENIIYSINQRPDLPPHGDLIGNVWITSDNSLKLIDPRGIPRDEIEKTSWIYDDQWQIEWIRESLEQS